MRCLIHIFSCSTCTSIPAAHHLGMPVHRLHHFLSQTGNPLISHWSDFLFNWMRSIMDYAPVYTNTVIYMFGESPKHILILAQWLLFLPREDIFNPLHTWSRVLWKKRNTKTKINVKTFPWSQTILAMAWLLAQEPMLHNVCVCDT